MSAIHFTRFCQSICGVLFVVGVAGFWAYAHRLALMPKILLGAALLVVATLLLYRACSWLFGPVLFYEMVRTSRRGRFFLLRIVSALFLLLFLWLVYAKFQEDVGFMYWGTGVRRRGWLSWVERADAIARLTETFFLTFMYVQFAAVLLLTPAYTAGTIAEEKDRRRFEFLLATDLSDREIVLGKLAACLANLTLVLIVGIPILSLTQLLGGIDPHLVLSGFAVTGLTMLSLASLSIVNSVYARKPRDAILLTYLFVIAYLMVSLLSLGPISYLKTPGQGQSIDGLLPELTVALLESFNTGNPVIMLFYLRAAVDTGTPLSEALPEVFRSYAIFHVLVSLICIAWAVCRMRGAAWVLPRPERERGRFGWRWWPRFRPALGNNSPMLWKEVVAEPGMTLHGAGMVVVVLIIIVSFAPAVWLVGKYLLSRDDGYGARYHAAELQDSLNMWVRLAGSGVACLTLVGVAVRAASSISGERERQTFDSLLTTHLSLRTILFTKWLGSILSVRGAWLWLVVIWMVGLLTGALHLSTLPWLLLAWSVYAAAFAALGLWFSLVSSGTLRATLLTLGLMTVLCFIHWLPWFFIELPHHAELPLTIQIYGLTPPAALGWLAFDGDSVQFNPLNLGQGLLRQLEDPMDTLLGIVIGLVVWVLLAYCLWRATLHRFQRRAER